MKIANANLLTQEEFARLGEVFHTDVNALTTQRDVCWRLAWNLAESYPASVGGWLEHSRAVQAALDCWNGGQL